MADAAYTALLGAADTDARKAAAEAVVAEIKKAGVNSADAGAVYTKALKSLQAGGKAGGGERESAAWLFKSLVDTLGTAALPAIRDMLLDVLKLQCDKVRECVTAGKAAVEGLEKLYGAYSLKLLMPTLLKACDGANKAPTLVAALKLIKAASHSAPIECSELTPDIIPVVTPMMADIKQEVKDAAAEVVEEICNNCNNRDIEPVLPKLISAMKNVDESEECIHSLAATTFVQVVGSAALSITVPLLMRGFKERKTAVKRQCAVIVENMSKLVLEPRDAAPFLPQLIPALERAKEEISDPEARERCGAAHGHMARIKTAADAAGPKVDVEKVSALVKSIVGGDGYNTKFIEELACSLVFYKVDDVEEWVETLGEQVEAAGKSKDAVKKLYEECEKLMNIKVEEEDEGDDAEELCNCKFTLAYGAKILLHNTVMKLKRGYRYGLLGGNDSGKTTLMRAIANGQVEGFPPADELRTVFVEADIQGDLSDLNIVDYIYSDARIQAAKIPRDDIEKMLRSVGFTEVMIAGAVAYLSGGWRMKLALARAMLQRADILLLDEPTNHLDVINVAWVKDYLNSLTNVTSIMVSHDTGLLNDVCTHIMQISNLKLVQEKGNLESFVANHPDAKAFFELKAAKFKFKFPQPGFIEGVKSKGKPLMKMDNCTFTYPTNTKPTISNITVRVSLASRVACVGVNGAGKSTMIKLLTGQLIPQTGEVWKHPNCRVAYVAQHAFVHIEQHLSKTPNEYIQWRYQGGEDKESLEKATMVLTEEEEKKIKETVELKLTTEDGNEVKVKRVIDGLTGARRTIRKENEYEIRFAGMSHDSNVFYPGDKLLKLGWEKHIKAVDDKIALRAGQYVRPLTKDNVEKHLEDVGLDREFGTHHRMSALSGGQKVKVVLAAAMWNQPHILILDEPTNYLDRESLGALSGAIEEFEGGVVMITHNNEFCSKLCPETWVLENGGLDCKGDAAWMETVMNEKTEFKQVEEMVDALGNVTKVKAPKKKLSRKELKAKAKIRKAKLERGEEVSSDEEDWE